MVSQARRAPGSGVHLPEHDPVDAASAGTDTNVHSAKPASTPSHPSGASTSAANGR